MLVASVQYLMELQQADAQPRWTMDLLIPIEGQD